MRGSVSKLWNGGGDGSVHSSVRGARTPRIVAGRNLTGVKA